MTSVDPTLRGILRGARDVLKCFEPLFTRVRGSREPKTLKSSLCAPSTNVFSWGAVVMQVKQSGNNTCNRCYTSNGKQTLCQRGNSGRPGAVAAGATRRRCLDLRPG